MAIKKSKKYHYAIGRRKTATATVRLYEGGTGKITINDKDSKEYISLDYAESKITAPLIETDNDKKFDITIKVQGSGVAAQADAITLGVAKALVVYNPELRAVLKPYGFLTRDSRRVERKKPGRHKARRGVQFSKR